MVFPFNSVFGLHIKQEVIRSRTGWNKLLFKYLWCLWPRFFDMKWWEWASCQGCPLISVSSSRWHICLFTVPATDFTSLLLSLKRVTFLLDLESKMRLKLPEKACSLARSPRPQVLSAAHFFPFLGHQDSKTNNFSNLQGDCNRKENRIGRSGEVSSYI